LINKGKTAKSIVAEMGYEIEIWLSKTTTKGKIIQNVNRWSDWRV